MMQGNGTRDLKTLTLQIDVVDFECRNLEQISLRASGQKSNTGIRFLKPSRPVWNSIYSFPMLCIVLHILCQLSSSVLSCCQLA